MGRDRGLDADVLVSGVSLIPEDQASFFGSPGKRMLVVVSGKSFFVQTWESLAIAAPCQIFGVLLAGALRL